MKKQVIKETKTVIVSAISRGGAGIAREENGRVLFIPFSAPGDTLLVEITNIEKNYADAKILKILSPSVIRQNAPCPAFTQCGGCEWQHLPYNLQWKTKSEGLKHALKRMQISWEHTWDEMPAEKIWNYRNRIQLRGHNSNIGFFARSSKNLIAIENCIIAREELNEKIPSLRKKGQTLPRPYKVEIEVLENNEVRESWNSSHAALGFRQVHDEQNLKLKNWVQKQILSSLPNHNNYEVWDLYGGFGNLSKELALYVPLIHCVDLSSPEENPPTNTAENFYYHKSTVLPWLQEQEKKFAKKTLRNPIVILDPPREGLSNEASEILRILEKFQVSTLITVGCDADAWAKDLARIVRKGWKIERLAALDLFPQTHHVEALALFSRK